MRTVLELNSKVVRVVPLHTDCFEVANPVLVILESKILVINNESNNIIKAIDAPKGESIIDCVFECSERCFVILFSDSSIMLAPFTCDNLSLLPRISIPLKCCRVFVHNKSAVIITILGEVYCLPISQDTIHNASATRIEYQGSAAKGKECYHDGCVVGDCNLAIVEGNNNENSYVIQILKNDLLVNNTTLYFASGVNNAINQGQWLNTSDRNKVTLDINDIISNITKSSSVRLVNVSSMCNIPNVNAFCCVVSYTVTSSGVTDDANNQKKKRKAGAKKNTLIDDEINANSTVKYELLKISGMGEVLFNRNLPDNNTPLGMDMLDGIIYVIYDNTYISIDQRFGTILNSYNLIQFNNTNTDISTNNNNIKQYNSIIAICSNHTINITHKFIDIYLIKNIPNNCYLLLKYTSNNTTNNEYHNCTIKLSDIIGKNLDIDYKKLLIDGNEKVIQEENIFDLSVICEEVQSKVLNYYNEMRELTYKSNDMFEDKYTNKKLKKFVNNLYYEYFAINEINVEHGKTFLNSLNVKCRHVAESYSQTKDRIMLSPSEWSILSTLIECGIFSISLYPNVLNYVLYSNRVDILALVAKYCIDLCENNAVDILSHVVNLPSSIMKHLSWNFSIHNNIRLNWHNDAIEVSKDKQVPKSAKKQKKNASSKNEESSHGGSSAVVHVSVMLHIINSLMKREGGYDASVLAIAIRRLDIHIVVFLLRIFSGMLREICRSKSFDTVISSQSVQTNVFFELDDKSMRHCVSWIKAILDAHLVSLTIASRNKDGEVHFVLSELNELLTSVETLQQESESLLGWCAHLQRSSGKYDPKHDRHAEDCTVIGTSSDGLYQIEVLHY